MAQFLRIELLVGLVGGFMPALLFVAHSSLATGAGAGAAFRVLLYGLVGLIGVVVGLRFRLSCASSSATSASAGACANWCRKC